MPAVTSSPVAWAMRRLPIKFAIGLDAADQRVAQPGLVGAAFRGRDRVAIGVAERVVLVVGPHHRPFDAAALSGKSAWPRNGFGVRRSRPSRLAARKSPSPPGKCSRASCGTPSGRGTDGSQRQRISTPRNR